MQGAELEYRFNDVRVDTRAHRVTRAGAELALEPKAYQVLLQLLARPGAVLERDELLDAVWGHRHVTPGVLNRVIAMLRHELGDDAEHPQTIRTVHGVGYSLIAPVTVVEATDSPPVSLETPSAAVGEGAVLHESDSPAPAQAKIVEARGPEIAGPPPAARSSRQMPIATLILVVVLLLALAWLWRAETRVPPVAQTAAPPPAAQLASSGGDARTTTLAVLPFASEGNDSELRNVALGLTDSFSEALARVADLRVTSSESTAIAIAADRTPGAVARSLSVRHVLDGRLRAIDATNLELELKLFDATGAEPVWTHVVTQARAQPFRMLGPALDAIRAGPLRQLGDARLDSTLDASMDAQDLYWLGRQRLNGREEGDWRRALLLFQRAVEIDPGFALAWTYISEGHRLLANAGQEPLLTSARLGLAALDRALALDPNLTQAYVQKAMLSTMQWRPMDGRSAAQRAMELAPNHPGVLALNGNIESYLGRPRAAAALYQRALAGNPLSIELQYLMGRNCTLLGDESCARARFGEARRLAGIQGPGTVQRHLGLSFGHVSAAALVKLTDVSRYGLYQILDRAQAWSMLGDDAEAARTLALLEAPRSAVPLHLAVHLDRFWREARWAEALAWAEGAGGLATQEPWRSIWTAQARVLAGDVAAGLRDYDRTLADPANRALLTSSWFPTRIGIGQVANWIALRRQAGVAYEAELAAMNADLAAMVEGGVDMSALDYHRAVAAVLAGDTAEADARLGRAIRRGWLDDVAFATDFVWRDVGSAPWLQARRAQIRERLAAERAIALAAGKDAAPIEDATDTH